jgi:predicted Zn-dependent protease
MLNTILSLTKSFIIRFFVTLAVVQLTIPPSATAFSVSEEKEVGEKLISIIREAFDILDEPDLSEYINDLGQQSLNHAETKFFDYHFFIISNKEFNAFTAPSGLIFIHSGLIEICSSENELVSVIAHEIGHAASRHIADRIDKSAKLNIGTAALMIAALALGQGALSEALITGSMAAGATMSLKFSRQDEEEADRIAYKLMQAQDRDPSQMVSMLQKMRRVSRYRRGSLPAYLLTHPEPEMRLGYIEDRLLLDLDRTYKPRDEFDFLRAKSRIDALTKESHILLPVLERKLKESPPASDEYFMAQYGLSQAYLANRQYEKAEAALNKVILRFPERTVLRTDLGRIYFEAGKFDLALTTFQKQAPGGLYKPYNDYQLARALVQAGSTDKAAELYENLIREIPTFSRLYYEMGQIRAAQGQKGASHYNLGLFYWYEGQTENARYHLRQALENLPAGDPVRKDAQGMLEKIDRLEKI